MKILNTCKDYKELKNNLDLKTLNKIDKILTHFENYMNKNWNREDINVYDNYYNIYGNGYVIDWFEGLIDTKEFIDIIKNNYCFNELKD